MQKGRVVLLLSILPACQVSWQAGSSVSGDTTRVTGESGSSESTVVGGIALPGKRGPSPASGDPRVEIPDDFEITSTGPKPGQRVKPKCRWGWRLAMKFHLGGGKYGRVTFPKKIGTTDTDLLMRLGGGKEVGCGKARKVGWGRRLKKLFRGCKHCLGAVWGGHDWSVVYDRGEPVYQRKPFKIYERTTPKVIGKQPAVPEAATLRSQLRSAFVQFSRYPESEAEFYYGDRRIYSSGQTLGRVTEITLAPEATFAWENHGNVAVYKIPTRATVAYRAGPMDPYGPIPYYYVTCNLAVELRKNRGSEQWRARRDCGDGETCRFPESCRVE